MKTLPQIDTAIRQKVAFHSKRGRNYAPVMPPLLFPGQVERKYMRQLNFGFIKLFDLVRDRLIATLPAIIDKYRRELAPQRFDAADDDLRLILDGLLVEFGRQLSENEIKSIALQRGIDVSVFNKRQLDKVFKRVLSVDVYTDEFWLEKALQQFSSENAALITTLSERHINEVRQLVVKGMRQGTTAKELSSLIASKVNGKTKANFRLIARDQIGKLNGQLTMLRQRDVGVTRYIWRTSLDERVRATHRAHEGQVFEWDKAPHDTGHPGFDFSCRCYAEPILTDLIE